jgi:hypothetical protein
MLIQTARELLNPMLAAGKGGGAVTGMGVACSSGSEISGSSN